MAIYAATPAELDLDPMGGADVQRILRHLRALPNPPNEDERGIVQLLNEPPGKEFVYIDDVDDVVVRLHTHAPAPPASWECIVAWWMWVGPPPGLTPQQRLAWLKQHVIPCFRVALEAFVAFYPLSLTWPIWGDLPTLAEATGLKTMFGAAGGVVVSASPRNVILSEARSTVDKILTRVRLL